MVDNNKGEDSHTDTAAEVAPPSQNSYILRLQRRETLLFHYYYFRLTSAPAISRAKDGDIVIHPPKKWHIHI